MFKNLYCASALLIGALVGANAPEEWRGDADPVARSAAIADYGDDAITIVYRPYQR